MIVLSALEHGDQVARVLDQAWRTAPRWPGGEPPRRAPSCSAPATPGGRACAGRSGSPRPRPPRRPRSASGPGSDEPPGRSSSWQDPLACRGEPQLRQRRQAGMAETRSAPASPQERRVPRPTRSNRSARRCSSSASARTSLLRAPADPGFDARVAEVGHRLERRDHDLARLSRGHEQPAGRAQRPLARRPTSRARE